MYIDHERKLLESRLWTIIHNKYHALTLTICMCKAYAQVVDNLVFIRLSTKHRTRMEKKLREMKNLLCDHGATAWQGALRTLENVTKNNKLPPT